MSAQIGDEPIRRRSVAVTANAAVGRTVIGRVPLSQKGSSYQPVTTSR
ncbi:hypothetical protein L843_0473 [Mycobacterium intracellulare MIN_061107_1834]|nr:hypothetical protein L843_0473 [Mycobacterium intracellulare MIN_061107_1834]